MSVFNHNSLASPSAKLVMLKPLFLFFSLLPLVVAAYMIIIDPRPFYLGGDADNEHFYYFGGKLFFDGHSVTTLAHPGLTLHWISYLIMSVLGSDFSRAQAFFNAAYVVIAVLSTLGVAAFVRLALSGVPLGLAAASLALALSGPSFWTYLTHYCADSPILGLGLIALGLFWSSLRLDQSPARVGAKLALCGLAGGLCLATKLSFLPLISSMLAGCFLRGLMLVRGRKIYGLYCLSAPLAALAVVAVLAIPFIKMSSSPADFFLIAGARSPNAGNAWRTFVVLSRWYPFFTAGICGAALITIAFSLAGLIHWRRRPKDESSGVPLLGFHLPSALVFLALGLAGLFLAGGSPRTKYIYDWGMAFRYIAPSCLVVPVAYVLLGVWLCRREDVRQPWWPWASRALVAIALAATMAEALSYTTFRHDFTARLRQEHIETQSYLQRAAGAATLVVWDGSPGYSLGELSFFLWGNYWYCNEKYDEQLLRMAPALRWLRLRDVPAIMRPSQSDTYYGGAEFLPPYRYRARNRVISNQQVTAAPLLVAVPMKEYSHEIGESPRFKGFARWLVSYLNMDGHELDVRRETVAGSEWGLIAMSPAKPR